jgi:ubiquinol-cytochrome c reductase cytochrome c subunit
VGRFAPKLKGVTEKHIYEAMLTGPQQMPVFSNGVLTPEDKRDIIAYLKSLDKKQTPATAASASAASAR